MTKEELAHYGLTQLDNESAYAFKALSTYAQMPKNERSFVKLYDHGYRRGTVANWSKMHNWANRIKTFDSKILDYRLHHILDAHLPAVISSIENSLSDSDVAREHAMKLMRETGEADKFAIALEARINVDRWMAEVAASLNTLKVHTDAKEED